MARRLAAAPLLAALALAACGPGHADFHVRGTAVVIASDAPFARQPDLPERIESTLAVALAYWGGRWADLDRSTLVLVGAREVECGGVAGAVGCWDGDLRISTEDPGTGTVVCLEQTVLVHEVGHAVIGDPRHTDPRWMRLEPVAEALRGRVGYGPDGPVECTLSLSTWRHPPDRSEST